MPRHTSLEALFTEITQPDSAEADNPLAAWGAADWRALLLDLPMDSATFAARFERSWDACIAMISDWFARHPDDSGWQEIYGYLGVLLLTLQSLRHSERYRSAGDAKPAHDCDRECRPLVRKPAVRGAIRRLYDPAGEVPVAKAEWDNLDFDTLEFHRHGTTSFILTGKPRRAIQGQLPTFALKCIVYPYSRLPTIERSTGDYARDFGVAGHDVRHLVRVWASCDRWILMDFVAGQTLAELLHREVAGSRRDELRLDLLDKLGSQLFLAMEELERCGLTHGDLSPSNIIVAPGDGAFTLIDLGVNYLYTHALTGASGPDARYIAPEVASHDGSSPRADLYSVGQLLIAFGGVGRATNGVVPDGYYDEAPSLARFIEDLIDGKPENRLLVFKPDGTGTQYGQLRGFFVNELAAVRVARGDRRSYPRWLASLVELFRPLLGMPRRQRRLWKLRREQRAHGARHGAHVRWLLFWSLVSAGIWYISLTVVTVWWLRDLNLDWGNQATAVLQRLTHTPEDQFPYLDQLRAADYPIPDFAGNLPVRLTAFTFAIVSARYYQGLFAGITPLTTGWRAGGLSAAAVVAEVLMRLGAIFPVVLILLSTLVERRWWPILMAIGMVYLFFTNWAAHAFASRAIRRARALGLSTVPREKIPGLESFAEWVPGALVYAACVGVVGLLIYNGQLKDVYFYAAGAATVNIALWYSVKLGLNIAPIRAGLTRACLATERIRYTSTARSIEPQALP